MLAMDDPVNEVIPSQRPGCTLGPVSNDWEAAEQWFAALGLRRPPISANTLSNYRREVDRVRWYCEFLGHRPLGEWSLTDVEQYLSFLRKDAGRFIQPRRGLSKHSEGWTPFRDQPSESAIANTQKVLHALMRFWLDAGYIRATPFAGVGGGRAQRAPGPRKAVPASLLNFVYDSMRERDKPTIVAQLTYLRNRFLIRTLEKTGLRAQELGDADMRDVQLITDPLTKTSYWSLYIRNGKGGREGRVPMPSSTMEDFRQYRMAFGLSDVPSANETGALILSPYTRNGDTAVARARDKRFFGMYAEIRNRARVWDIVKSEFNKASELLANAGRFDEAAVLGKASPHWLRHTTATALSELGVDVRAVAKVLRHRDLNTTMTYSQGEFLDLAKVIEMAGW